MNKASSTAKSCPICDKKTDEKYRPFCSKRCADVDLNRWFGENYRIPADEAGVSNETYVKETGDD